MTFRQLLRQRIEESGGFAVAAEKLGCTREHLYALCSDNNAAKIGIDLAASIDTLFGIPMAEWAIERGAA